MIIFGQAKNITIEDHRRPKHFGARKFIPVFERVGECYHPKKGFFQGKRYREEFWWSGAGRSTRRMSWVVFHLTIKHRGQKNFFRELFRGK